MLANDAAGTMFGFQQSRLLIDLPNGNVTQRRGTGITGVEKKTMEQRSFKERENKGQPRAKRIVLRRNVLSEIEMHELAPMLGQLPLWPLKFSKSHFLHISTTLHPILSTVSSVLFQDGFIMPILKAFGRTITREGQCNNTVFKHES